MQIRTAFAIGTGIVIGTFAGMCVSEDRKCKMFAKIRKKLIYALGGEEKKYEKSPNFVSYSSKYKPVHKANPNKDKKEFNHFNDDYFHFLICDNPDDANALWNRINECIDSKGSMSVIDLALMRNGCCDYTWDKWGWRKEDLPKKFDIHNLFNGKWVLDIGTPVYLKD